MLNSFPEHILQESPTSGAASAAWISKYYHGLQYIRDWRERTGKSDILWIDLADEFVETGLRESRLYLRPRSRNAHDSARSHTASIKTIFDSIRVVGLLQSVQDYLFREDSIPAIHSDASPDMIVISGWDRLSSSTPSFYEARLEELKSSLVRQLSDSTASSILWFDDPVPGEQNSSVYAARTLVPYYRDSPFFGVVTQIIWNLPVAPESETLPDEWVLPYPATAPLYDDVRVIVAQKQKEFAAELVNVPPLVGWSRKFRSELLEPQLDSLLEETIPPSEIRDRIKILAFDLIPWLPKLWPQSSIGAGNQKPVYQQLRGVRERYNVPRERVITDSEVLTQSVEEPQLLERIRFRPQGPDAGKSFISLAVGTINSQRFYRSPYSIRSKERPSYMSSKTTNRDVRLLFGRTFVRTTSEMQDELMVIEDPADSTRLLIGHFIESSKRNQSGFLWSERDTDRLLSLLDEFDSLDSEDIIVRIIDNRQELWKWDFDGKRWRPRSIIEIVSNRSGQVGVLLGICENPLSTEDTIASGFRPRHHFNQLTKQSLQQLIELEKTRKLATVSLARNDAFCDIRFQDPTEGEVIHVVRVQSTPDLINTLRLPFQGQRLPRGENGRQLTWKPFIDIEYSEFEVIRPYIETNAPRDVGKVLPTEIQDLGRTGEEQIMHLILGHDTESCPLFLNTGVLHDRCWTLKSKDVSPILPQFQVPISGKEVYGHLSTGTIRSGQRIYSIQLSLKHDRDSREFYVYHEDSWIRKLLREMNMNLKKLEPGTYLRDDERWIIDYAFQENDIEWTGVSTVSGIRWKDQVFRFRLNSALNLQQTKSGFLDSIVAQIPSKLIVNLNELDREIEMILSNRGYGQEGPRCKLSVFREDRTITVVLSEMGELQPRLINKDSFTIERNDNCEEILESFYYRLESGEFSSYNIINEKEFLRTLETLLDEIDFSDDD